jgi:hypothetical protein
VTHRFPIVRNPQPPQTQRSAGAQPVHVVTNADPCRSRKRISCSS